MRLSDFKIALITVQNDILSVLDAGSSAIFADVGSLCRVRHYRLRCIDNVACKQQHDNTTNKLLLTTMEIDCIEYWNLYNNLYVLKSFR